jgi:hypothetical protein
VRVGAQEISTKFYSADLKGADFLRDGSVDRKTVLKRSDTQHEARMHVAADLWVLSSELHVKHPDNVVNFTMQLPYDAWEFKQCSQLAS